MAISSRRFAALGCRHLAAIAVALLASLTNLSCMSKQPPPAPLNTQALTTTLVRGVSTAADVRAALGEPTGRGAALLPTADGGRTVWFYERMQVNILVKPYDIKQEVLMVFFDNDVFDGYLWFSSEKEKPQDAAADSPAQSSPSS